MAAFNGDGVADTSPVPDVEIELDKPRLLRFDFNALRLAENRISKEWGKKTSVTSVMTEDITITDLCILVWAALYADDNSLTLDQVGKMLHPRNMNYVAEKIRDAFGVQVAADDEEEASDTTDPQKP